MCALNRSVMRATSSALASSTDSSFGLGVVAGARAGAETTVRGSASAGRVMMVIEALLFGGNVSGGHRVAVEFLAVFLVGRDQHVVVAELRHPPELALGFGDVEHADLVGDQILLRIHDRQVD